MGPQHPDTLNSLNNLAVLLYKQGKLEEAGLRSLWCREVAEVSRGRHFPCGQEGKGFLSFIGGIWESEHILVCSCTRDTRRLKFGSKLIAPGIVVSEIGLIW